MRIVSAALGLFVALSPAAWAADALTPDLIDAARIGDIEAVKGFVADGSNVNAKTKDGATPLLAAVEGGNLAAVKTLLAHGAQARNRSPIRWSSSFFCGDRPRASVSSL